MSTLDFQINTDLSGDHSRPEAAVLANGNVVIVWQADGAGFGDTVDSGITLRIYDQLGTVKSYQIAVNSYTTSDQIDPSITALSDGGFLVTWSSNGQDGSGWGIYAQRFNANGGKLGLETRVNTTNGSDQVESSVTALPNGGYVVAWRGQGSDTDVFFQMYNALGYKVGGETLLNEIATGFESNPDIIGLQNGGFAAVFQDDGQIRLAQFDSTGTRIGTDSVANSIVNSDVLNRPKIDVLSNGDLVVTWYNNSFGGVHARLFNPDGTPQGAQFQVSDPAFNPGSAFQDVAALEDGGFVISWINFGTQQSTFAQRYDSSGTAIGDISQVLVGAVSSSTFGTVVALKDGGFMVLRGMGSGFRDIFAAIHDQGTNLADYETFGVATDYRARGGDDLLYGSSDGDVLRGGAGDDIIYGNAGDDVIRLGLGGISGGQAAYGGGGQDLLIDSSSGSELFGGGGDDILRGGSGNDTLFGGSGDDSLNGGANDDVLSGQTGIDNLSGGDGEDTIYGGDQKDNITGGTENDELYGDDGADVIKGGSGEDILFGGAGQDRLDGGTDNDILYGGSGADTFLFSNTSFGEDVIMDFEDGSDIIRITAGSLTFADVTITDVGGNALVEFASGELMVLNAAGLLTSDDFSF